MKGWAVISASSLKGGLGAYARRLYSLGLFDSLLLFKNNPTVSEEGYDRVLKSPLPFQPLCAAHVAYSFHFSTRWSSTLKELALVHFSSPDWFHLARYNPNSYGTVHDLFPLTWPSSYAPHYRRFYRKELEAASLLKGVVVISDYVKGELSELYPNLKLIRIHHWTGNEFRPRDRALARKKLGLPLDKKVVLSIGTEEPRKNVDALISAFKSLGEGFMLVRIGSSRKFRSLPGAALLSDVPFDVLPSKRMPIGHFLATITGKAGQRQNTKAFTITPDELCSLRQGCFPDNPSVQPILSSS